MSLPQPNLGPGLHGSYEHSSKDLFEQRVNSYSKPLHMSPKQAYIVAFSQQKR
jgi:hypothetical protein